MVHTESRSNPEGLSDVLLTHAGRRLVNGVDLYAEVRGSGPVVLLVGAADEDAELFRPIAERLSGRTVVTYDRRGTLRSGRNGWPGGGSRIHADDAAGLIRELGFVEATVFGGSAGGIVGLQAALRHPDVFHRALIFEPGLFSVVPGGPEIYRHSAATIEAHLATHPEDWLGARAALGREIATLFGLGVQDFFQPPEGKEWYAQRTDANAEALIRGDIELTGETIDEAVLAASPISIRFSYGTRSLPIFEHITKRLSATRGQTPDRLVGVSHGAYYHPDEIASYLLEHSAPS